MKSIFGSAQYFEITSNQSIEDALEDTLKLIPSGILILCCDQSYVEPAYFDSLLKSAPCTVVGGVFPEVIVGSQTYEKGLVLVPIFSSVEVEVIRDLTQIPSRPLTFGMKVQDYSSLLVLVDGLSRNVDHALNQIFAHCGQQLKVFGGGAGSLSFAEKPYLFSNEGVLADAMLVIAMVGTY